MTLTTSAFYVSKKYLHDLIAVFGLEFEVQYADHMAGRLYFGSQLHQYLLLVQKHNALAHADVLVYMRQHLKLLFLCLAVHVQLKNAKAEMIRFCYA